MCVSIYCDEVFKFKFGLCKECYLTKRTASLVNYRCLICDKKLRKFRSTADWDKRVTHKQCVKKWWG